MNHKISLWDVSHFEKADKGELPRPQPTHVNFRAIVVLCKTHQDVAEWHVYYERYKQKLNVHKNIMSKT